MLSMRTRQPGFALPAAIFAIVVLGAVVTGGFYAASQEGRIGNSARLAGEAFHAAERGIHEVLGTHTRAELEQLEIDEEMTVGPVPREAGGITTSYTVTIRRMADRIYYLESTGQVLSGGHLAGATRRVGMMVRTRTMDGEFDQALRVFGQLGVAGASKVSGNDTIPDAWTDQCEMGAATPGIVLQDSTLLTTTGQAHTIAGDPPVTEDPDMTSEDFAVFGDMTFDELALLAMAYGKVYGPTENESDAHPGASDQPCDVNRRSNWGAPTDASHPCHLYFPIIFAAGEDRTFHLAGNSVGQGILLVEGDMRISGNARFYGIVIVKGTFETGTGTARVNGTVLVGSNGSLEPEDESSISGTPTVQYSRCAIERAQIYNDALSRAVPLVERSWVDLTLVRAGV